MLFRSSHGTAAPFVIRQSVLSQFFHKEDILCPPEPVTLEKSPDDVRKLAEKGQNRTFMDLLDRSIGSQRFLLLFDDQPRHVKGWDNKDRRTIGISVKPIPWGSSSLEMRVSVITSPLVTTADSLLGVNQNDMHIRNLISKIESIFDRFRYSKTVLPEFSRQIAPTLEKLHSNYEKELHIHYGFKGYWE